jgi:pilus assembly protein CpaB
MIAISVVVAFAAVVAAARWVNEQGAGGTNRLTVAAADIQLGQPINPQMVKLVEWPSGSIPPGAFNDPKSVDTRVAKTSIQRGEPILESKLAPLGTKGGLSAVVPEGKRAMTVKVNEVIGVAGFALPGNFVDIMVNTQEEGSGRSRDKDQQISKIVLERILVLAVAQEASQDQTKPKVVSAVTLEVTPEEAEKLDLARSVGTLSLVLRNQVDPKTAMTEGATKRTLLAAAPEPPAAQPETKTVVKKVVVYRAPAKVAAANCVQVLTGTKNSQECF